MNKRTFRRTMRAGIPVSEGLYSLLRDRVVREYELNGRTVTVEQVLDEAITAVLDQAERRS